MMPPMVVVMAAVVMVMPRHDHVRHEMRPVMTVVATMVVVPAVMMVLRENDRVRILGRNAAIDRRGA